MPSSAGRGQFRTMYVWYVVVVLLGAHLVSFLDRGIVVVALEPLKSAFAASDAELGALYGTSFALLYAVAGLPLGLAADRFNRRVLICAGMLAWSAATFAFGLATSFTQLFMARVALGLGEAALVPAAMSLIADMVEPGQLGKAVALFLIGPPYGMSAAYLLGGFVFSSSAMDGLLSLLHLHAAWRLLFLLAALPGVVILLLMLLTVREPARERRSHIKAASDHSYLLQHWRAYAVILLASTLLIFSGQAMVAWIPSFFVRTYSLSLGTVSYFLGIATLIATPLSALASGWMLDRLRRRKVQSPAALVLCAAQALAVPITFFFWFARSLWLSVTALILMGFLVGLATPAILTAIQVMTPSRLRGFATAVLMTSITLLGLGLGPAFCGYLADHVFSGPRALASAIAVLGIGGWTISAIITWLGRPAIVRANDATSAETAVAAAPIICVEST